MKGCDCSLFLFGICQLFSKITFRLLCGLGLIDQVNRGGHYINNGHNNKDIKTLFRGIHVIVLPPLTSYLNEPSIECNFYY